MGKQFEKHYCKKELDVKGCWLSPGGFEDLQKEVGDEEEGWYIW